MRKLIIKLILIIGVLYLGSEMLGIVEVLSPTSAIIFACVLLLINMTIKPILLLISLPVTVLTVGLFSLVINTWMVMLADRFVSGVTIEGFLNSLLIAVSFSLLNGILLYNKR